MARKEKSFNAIADDLGDLEATDENANNDEIALLKAAKEKAEREAKEAKQEAEKAKREAEEAKKKVSKEETRSRHVQILVTPTMYEAVKEKTLKDNISVNEFVNRAIEKALQK